MPKYITHSSWFWLSFASLSLAGILFSWYYFPRAFPLVNINLELNRVTALEKARDIAKNFDLGPTNYQQTTSFEVENETKTFIELEGGGKKNLNKLLSDELYSPYHWTVRHFKEYDTHELNIFFSAQGTCGGFIEKIPENFEGPALSQQEARKIGEEQTEKNWNIPLSDYSLIEVSQEEKPNKRLDHTFVYEKLEKKLENIQHRLTVIIQGDRLTKVKPYIQIPEGFQRRYEHMRSSNQTISIIALFFIILFYIFSCGFGGLIYLYHYGLLSFKMPIFWAAVISTLQFFNSLNNIPLMWLQYDTATAISHFLTQIFLGILVQWGLLFCILSLIFAVAEGLTRCAFEHHPQLWKVWSIKNLASWQILGRTIGGYLMVGIDIAFVVSVYAFASRYLGWWTPSDALVNPNILATYVPWFSSIAQSAMAGFMEECLFRALPLASALLLGKYCNRPRLFVAIAFIMQTIIFGAAHANYPAQPAYARLLELIIPSAVFGGLYLVYGLLPAIISHFVYDIVWFALPLFVTKAPGSFINQAMVVMGALLPLLIVLIARLRTGAWTSLSTSAYNKASRIPNIIKEKNKKHTDFYIPYNGNIQEKHYTLVILAGAFGLLLWLGTTRFNHDGYSLASNRHEILDSIQSSVSTIPELYTSWTKLAYVKTETDAQHIFVWRTSGKDIYHQLLGTYLAPAYWLIRLASFEGDIAQRAEEYQWYLGPNKTLLRKKHILPEEQSGKNLDQPDACVVSLEALMKYFNFEPTQINSISAISSKKPHRIDWTFTYHTPTPKQLCEGQTRVTTTIANNEAIDIYKHIFVPETWLRNYTQEKALNSIITLICTLLLILLFVSLSSIVIFHAGFFSIHYTILSIFGLALLAKSSIQLFNLWPIFQSNYSTSQPYSTQMAVQLIILFLQIVTSTALYSYFASVIYPLHMHITRQKNYIHHVFIGASSGALYAGISAFLKRIGPSLQPLWPDYSYLGAHIPWLNMALTQSTLFVTLSLQALLIFLGLDYLTQGWQQRKIVGSILCVLLGIGLTGVAPIETIHWLLISGSVRGLLFLALYIYSFRYKQIRIIWAIAVLFICNILQQVFFNAWSGVILGSIVSVAFIVGISLLWTWYLYRYQKNTNSLS